MLCFCLDNGSDCVGSCNYYVLEVGAIIWNLKSKWNHTFLYSLKYNLLLVNVLQLMMVEVRSIIVSGIRGFIITSWLLQCHSWTELATNCYDTGVTTHWTLFCSWGNKSSDFHFSEYNSIYCNIYWWSIIFFVFSTFY